MNFPFKCIFGFLPRKEKQNIALVTRPVKFKAENETAWQKKVIEEKKEGRQHTIEELISKGQHFFQAEDYGSALEVYTHGIENVSKVRQTFTSNINTNWQRSSNL